jgi:hypothetical protein
MEAIMKAFERLEKAEQRRQENQAKQAHRKEHQQDAANSSTPKKEPVSDTKKVSVEVGEEGPRSHGSNVKPSASERQRRKRYLGKTVVMLRSFGLRTDNLNMGRYSKMS